MQSSVSSPKPSLLNNKLVLALIIFVLFAVGVARVFAINYFQRNGMLPGDPYVLE